MKRLWLLPASLFFICLPALCGCAPSHETDRRIEAIARPYRFHLAAWECRAILREAGEFCLGDAGIPEASVQDVTGYFQRARRIKELEKLTDTGRYVGDPAAILEELAGLREENSAKRRSIIRVLEVEVGKALRENGITNPLLKEADFGFPPVAVYLGSLPRLLVVSPRERIERIKDVLLLPDMDEVAMESLEAEVDRLGVSSLVVELGGLATYPTYIADDGDLSYALETIVHEWVHQYLAFTPLGFRYVLDRAGLRRDQDIVTINETVADIVAEEISAQLCLRFCPDAVSKGGTGGDSPGFDFNRAMREIRLTVDEYLSRGEVEAAEAFMKEKRQYLEQNGYYIRKLNQAYFAFHGTYADSPASVSPIGEELSRLRQQCASLKEFLAKASSLGSREALSGMVD
ncbi:MAG: hypothetical protein N2506_04365 [Dehalococcoidales bacterium]|nr:hypothetical protein [Dehalococcoidales bacterium]